MSFAVPLADRIELLLRHPALEQSSSDAVAASPHVRRAIAEALYRGETHYTDRPGILPLREAVAALLRRRFALDTNARDNVIITCSMTEARLIATQQMLQPGDLIAAANSSERLYGPAVLRQIQMTTLAGPDTRAVYLTSSTPEAELRSHVDAVPPTAFIIYEIDEQENRFHPAQLPGSVSRTFTLGTLGPDHWRVGYLAAASEFSSGLRDFKQNLTICTTSLSQWAVLAALEEK